MTQLIFQLTHVSYLNKNLNSTGIFFETAHPIKFSEDVEKSLGIKLKKPKLAQKIYHNSYLK